MEMWTPEEEAERLAKRFEGVNQAAFARKHRVPGGASMVSQHLKARRPMSLEAATAYANGFGVPLEDISPRHAAAVAAAKSTSANDPNAAPEIPAGALPVDPSSFRRIWVVGKGAGGLPKRIWTDGDHPVGMTDLYGEVLSADPLAFLAEVAEDSMIPVFNPKNYVLVEPSTAVDLEDKVLVRLADGTTLMKRLLARRDGYTFGSFNDPKLLHYSPEEVTWIYYIAFEVPRKKIKSRLQ